MKFLIINLLCVGVTLGNLTLFPVLFSVSEADPFRKEGTTCAGVPAFRDVLLNYTGRITGGKEVVPHSRPFQCALFIKDKAGGWYFCGGSLISPSWVLTAAHCVDNAEEVHAIFGAHNILQDEESQLEAVAANIFVHPQWDYENLMNDVALCQFSEPVPLSDNIQTVALPPMRTFDYQTATASGWGLDSDAATDISPCLREVDLSVIPNWLCSGPFLFSIENCHLCGSGLVGKSTCSGDSGGPLTVTILGITTQIGIVSFGISVGCEKGWPSVFVRLTVYVEWIKTTMNAPPSY